MLRTKAMSDGTRERNPLSASAAPAVVASAASASASAAVADSAIDHIRDALRGLKFGLVSIVVQDGVVIQIERTERRRLR
jgi:hypothetical protein